nr:hypothetical protein [uncultured Anaeromusa sp.]
MFPNNLPTSLRPRTVLLLGLLALLLSLAFSSSSEKQPPTSQFITANDVSQLHPGMTYEETARLLRREGQEVTSINVPQGQSSPAASTSFMVWRNEDDTALVILFRDNRILKIYEQGIK